MYVLHHINDLVFEYTVKPLYNRITQDIFRYKEDSV